MTTGLQRAGPYTAVMTNESIEHPDPVAVASYATLGEAEVAQAALRASGIESGLDDQIEGGAIPVEGEATVIVTVHPDDADDARQILGS